MGDWIFVVFHFREILTGDDNSSSDSSLRVAERRTPRDAIAAGVVGGGGGEDDVSGIVWDRTDEAGDDEEEASELLEAATAETTAATALGAMRTRYDFARGPRPSKMVGPSFSCFLKWRSRLVCWPKQRSQIGHLYGFSLLWMLRTWRWRLDEMEKDLSQKLHLYGCSPVCVRRCRVKFAERGNVLPQYLHPYLSVFTFEEAGTGDEDEVNMRLSVFCTEMAVEAGGELDRRRRSPEPFSKEEVAPR